MVRKLDAMDGLKRLVVAIRESEKIDTLSYQINNETRDIPTRWGELRKETTGWVNIILHVRFKHKEVIK